ncbi:MAG: glycerophosphodiester phosphodiesterase family protein [Saprospiraceae bacterium]
MRVYLIVIFFLFSLSSCFETNEARLATQFDTQGHRGARGRFPENTMPGFKEAIDQGMRTLELDVCVSADSVIVVSHEPWFNPIICIIDSLGYAEKESLFKMTYAEIASVDCGSRGNIDFPSQVSVVANKPSLYEVIVESQRYALEKNKPLPFYNIEIKTEPGQEGHYTPEIAAFVELVITELTQLEVLDRSIIQSFNVRPLQIIHEEYPEVRLAYLSSTPLSYRRELENLGFTPTVYSPYHLSLRPSTVQALHAQGVQVIPWTVNDVTRMTELVGWGVDGIISDYPGRLASVAP